MLANGGYELCNITIDAAYVQMIWFMFHLILKIFSFFLYFDFQFLLCGISYKCYRHSLSDLIRNHPRVCL